jgi:glycosyltransferase involved in cell wall biosynthesis
MAENTTPHVSVIIALYKDLEALRAALAALQRQTYRSFEVVIAEDDENEKTESVLSEFGDLSITHVSQPDRGNYKVVIQNEAIAKSRGEYLIFIDGDCVVYANFIEAHLALAKEKRVLCGRRVNLGPLLSTKVKRGELDPFAIERAPWRYLPTMVKDEMDHLDELLTLDPNGWLYSVFSHFRKKKEVRLLGCHFSAYRTDVMAINGFDEGYDDHPLAHDTDLDWRFKASGCELVSCKYVASMFHLYHGKRPYKPRNHQNPHHIRMRKMQEEGRFYCEKGLNAHLA